MRRRSPSLRSAAFPPPSPPLASTSFVRGIIGCARVSSIRQGRQTHHHQQPDSPVTALARGAGGSDPCRKKSPHPRSAPSEPGYARDVREGMGRLCAGPILTWSIAPGARSTAFGSAWPAGTWCPRMRFGRRTETRPRDRTLPRPPVHRSPCRGSCGLPGGWSKNRRKGGHATSLATADRTIGLATSLGWLTGLSLNPTPLLGCGRLRGRRPLQLPSRPGLLGARRHARARPQRGGFSPEGGLGRGVACV